MLAVPPDFPNYRPTVRALKLDNGEDRKRLQARRAFGASTQEGIRRANTEALLQLLERSLWRATTVHVLRQRQMIDCAHLTRGRGRCQKRGLP